MQGQGKVAEIESCFCLLPAEQQEYYKNMFQQNCHISLFSFSKFLAENRVGPLRNVSFEVSNTQA